jgi:hypothetical protein
MNEWVLIATCKQLVWSTRIDRNMTIWILRGPTDTCSVPTNCNDCDWSWLETEFFYDILDSFFGVCSWRFAHSVATCCWCTVDFSVLLMHRGLQCPPREHPMTCVPNTSSVFGWARTLLLLPLRCPLIREGTFRRSSHVSRKIQTGHVMSDHSQWARVSATWTH